MFPKSWAVLRSRSTNHWVADSCLCRSTNHFPLVPEKGRCGLLRHHREVYQLDIDNPPPTLFFIYASYLFSVINFPWSSCRYIANKCFSLECVQMKVNYCKPQSVNRGEVTFWVFCHLSHTNLDKQTKKKHLVWNLPKIKILGHLGLKLIDDRIE